MTFARSRCLFPAVIVLTLFLPSAGADDKEPRGLSAAEERLKRFRKADAAARNFLVGELAQGKATFHEAKLGDVVSTLVERGSVDAAVYSDVVCRLKAHTKGSPIASTIKWVIDEGTSVKKGERVLELDDSPIRDQITAQKIALDQATAAATLAEEAVKAVRKANQVEVRLGEIAVRLAELELKKDPGTDKDQREILELRLEKARLELERTKTQAKAKEDAAEADLRAGRAIAEQEAARVRELEEELKKCVLAAPRDGVVYYYTPGKSRSDGATPLIAQGEPVKEGQRLLRIPELKRMQVNVRVVESLISRVRVGQKASVHVDALPDRKLSATVSQIGTVGSSDRGVKTYPVVVTLSDEVPGLKPGLSAAVAITLEQRTKVLQVPVTAVVSVGKERICFVLTPHGIEEQRVTTGVSGDRTIEIKEGIKEGEQVLRDVPAVLRQLYPKAAPDGR